MFSCLFMYLKLQELVLSHGRPETNAETKARFILLDFKFTTTLLYPSARPMQTHTRTQPPSGKHRSCWAFVRGSCRLCDALQTTPGGGKGERSSTKTLLSNTHGHSWDPSSPSSLPVSHTHTHSCMDAHVERDFNQRSFEGCLYILSVGRVDFDQGQTIRINVCVYVLHVSKQMIKNDLLNGQKGTFKRRKSP